MPMLAVPSSFPPPLYTPNGRMVPIPRSSSPPIPVDPLDFVDTAQDAVDEANRVSDWVKSQMRSSSLFDSSFDDLIIPTAKNTPPRLRSSSKRSTSPYVPPPRMCAPAPAVPWWDQSYCLDDDAALLYAAPDIKAPQPLYADTMDFDLDLDLRVLNLSLLSDSATPPLSPSNSNSSSGSSSSDSCESKPSVPKLRRRSRTTYKHGTLSRKRSGLDDIREEDEEP